MRQILLPISLIALALAVPIIPFLGFGAALETRLESAIERIVDPLVAAALVVGLLSVDVFLPIPSSVLSTLGGDVLGFFWGTAASFAGLSLGAVIGFGLARAAGHPLVRRLAAAEDLDRIGRLSQRLGTAVLVVTRPVPILAEAAVVFFGAAGLPWRRFLAPVAIVNLLIAAAYSALGRWVHLPAALLAAIAAPAIATLIAQKVVASREKRNPKTEDH